MSSLQPRSLRFTCPNCKRSLKVSLSKIGKILPCPACKSLITIPHKTTSQDTAYETSTSNSNHDDEIKKKDEKKSEIMQIKSQTMTPEPLGKENHKVDTIKQVKCEESQEIDRTLEDTGKSSDNVHVQHLRSMIIEAAKNRQKLSTLVHEKLVVYAQPNLNAEIIAELRTGDKLVIGKLVYKGNRNWLEIHLVDGRFGFVDPEIKVFQPYECILCQETDSYKELTVVPVVNKIYGSGTKVVVTDMTRVGEDIWLEIRDLSGAMTFISGTTLIRHIRNCGDRICPACKTLQTTVSGKTPLFLMKFVRSMFAPIGAGLIFGLIAWSIAWGIAKMSKLELEDVAPVARIIFCIFIGSWCWNWNFKGGCKKTMPLTANMKCKECGHTWSVQV